MTTFQGGQSNDKQAHEAFPVEPEMQGRAGLCAEEATQEVTDLPCLYEAAWKQREAWIWSRARRKVSVALYRGTTSAEGLRMKVRVPELRGQRGGPFLKMSFGAQMRSSKRKKDLIAR